MFYDYPKDFMERELALGTMARLVWGKTIMLSILDVQPNSKVAIHSHPHEQFGFILEGEIEITIGGETRIVKKGDVYYAPSNTPHGGRSLNEKVQILDVFSPPREDYMK